MATRIRRIVDEEDVVDDAEVVNRSVERAPWSPAQIVALVIGAIFVILGGVALANTGIDLGNITANHSEVAGIDHTPLLAILELVIGLCLIGAGALPGGARGAMTFFGVILLGFGIVMALANDSGTAMQRWLGGGDGAAWFYALCGVALLLSAMLAPVIFGTDRSRVARRTAVVER